VVLRAGLDTELKAKAVSQHAMVALGGRGDTAANHSRPWHYMGENGQRHAPATL
jgi:hypothetical protein